MTQVTINYSTASNNTEMPTSEVVPGNWYIVTKYPYNSSLIGEIGVGLRVDESAGIVTPDGNFYCNEHFVVKELSLVEISYKE